MISPTVSSQMISSPTTSTPTTSTLTVTTCLSSTGTRTVHSTKIAVSSLDSQKKRVGKQGGHAHNQPITFADASTCTSPTMPTTSGNRRWVSVLSLKKVCVTQMYTIMPTCTCAILIENSPVDFDMNLDNLKVRTYMIWIVHAFSTIYVKFESPRVVFLCGESFL